MKTSENINELAKAMVSMQAELGTATKDCTAYNYKYADLAAVWSVIRDPLVSNGLMVMQDALTLSEGVSVSTRVTHESGQWIEFGPLIVPMGKKDAHSTGSAITYAKRYQICAALGVVTEDDDGHAAMRNAPKKSEKACSDKEYEAFLDLWSAKYPRDKILEYLEKRSAHFEMSVKQTVALLMQDTDRFDNEFLKWFEKHSS